MKLTIGITTFSKRLHFVTDLIKDIRTQTSDDIIVGVNGNYKQQFDDKFRKDILNLCARYPAVFPVFFPEQRGLAKIWNTILIHSKHDKVLMLNDDVKIVKSDTLERIKSIPEEHITVNPIHGTFSYFLCSKTTIDDLGYFDERLLGFGEEDGDIRIRYFEKYKKFVKEYENFGFHNIIDKSRDEGITRGVGKYSKFNRDFWLGKYIEDPNVPVVPGSGRRPKRQVPEMDLYPVEKFFQTNKYKL